MFDRRSNRSYSLLAEFAHFAMNYGPFPTIRTEVRPAQSLALLANANKRQKREQRPTVESAGETLGVIHMPARV